MVITQELVDELLNNALAIKVTGSLSEEKQQEGLAKVKELK